MATPPIHPHAGEPETRAIMVRANEISITRFRVEVVAGVDQGATCTSSDSELTIGTAPQNDLILKDHTVSRHHASITAVKGGFLIRDLTSTNGTTLAGYRIESAFLKPGAVIGVGETQLRFEILADEIHEPLGPADRYSRMLGQSAAMRRVFTHLPRIAASDATVLIEGETGTGKSLLAELVHQQSARAKGPFVVIDCGAIPPTLIEAELFGHAKGAFTGAQAARTGSFEAANGGTIFLDEIGELPIDMQPKLLRALEERTIRRVGSLESVRLDVRVIAATNRDLRAEVNRGTFRSDLFYRLNVVRLRIPPLRERPEDIPPLVAHFYEQFARDEDAGPPASLLAELMVQPWPGNVRELRGAVERATLMGDPTLWRDAVFGAESPDSAVSAKGAARVEVDLSSPFREAKEREVARWERAYVQALVRSSEGNVSRAARAGRMDRNHLRELLRRHAVTASDD